jgi:hypothetical protein
MLNSGISFKIRPSWPDFSFYVFSLVFYVPMWLNTRLFGDNQLLEIKIFLGLQFQQVNPGRNLTS